MAIEPCPFYGARIIPLMIGIFKKCPVCGRMWYDAGGGRIIRKRYGYGGGGAEAQKHMQLHKVIIIRAVGS